MTQILKVIKVHKSAMQTVRKYTHLRAFAELGGDGTPIGYFIESDGVKQTDTKVRGNGRGPLLGPSTNLRLNKLYSDGTPNGMQGKVQLLLATSYFGTMKNPYKVVKRKQLTTWLEYETDLSRSNISGHISKFIKSGFLCVVDE